MKICFYAPFKPLDHKDPSGDLVIAESLYDFLSKQGHTLKVASALRTRWIFWKPWLVPFFIREQKRVIRRFSRNNTDLWLTYHSYYKGPDILGPAATERNGIPYVIFQGVYSTKRKRDFRTWPGFFLNKRALCAARHVFTNKRVDLDNLKRLLPSNRITYIAPGIFPEDFTFDASTRDQMRRKWCIGEEPVVLSAAMFRPGVKTKGLEWVIRACGRLFRKGRQFYLVIAGEGKEKPRLSALAEAHLPGKVRFIGKVPREKMYQFYSTGDLFVFPGIKESLGMVYLEAQACGLPVVAFANEGTPEVIKDSATGYLPALYAADPFDQAIDILLTDERRRRKMGQAARLYVRTEHDLNKNYQQMEKILEKIVDSQY